ncbi:MAG: DUF4397 domain-containing protein [Bacteroidota bacterium]
MKHLKLSIVAALLILTAASCTKTNYDPPPAIAAISFYNASPDAPPLSIYLNSNKIQNDSVAYKSGIDYVNAYPGNREVNAYRNGTKTITKSITFDEGKFYSVFLTGNYSTGDFVALQDSLIAPAPGKATIRFVNMGIGAPVLDLVLTDGTKIVDGRAYKQNSAFAPIDGDKQYNFVIREHGTTVDKVVLPSVEIVAGHNYTIWARGIYTATDGAAIGASIVRNY